MTASKTAMKMNEPKVQMIQTCQERNPDAQENVSDRKDASDITPRNQPAMINASREEEKKENSTIVVAKPSSKKILDSIEMESDR